MSDWVHCNVCFGQPTNGLKFVLTECGHMECAQCSGEGTMCHVCNKPSQTIQLSSKMKPEIEMYFQDPTEFVTKCAKQYMQIINFQRDHRNRFFKHLVEKAKHDERISRLEKEIAFLRDENSQLRKKLSASNMSPAAGSFIRSSKTPAQLPSAVIHPSPQHLDWNMSPANNASRARGDLVTPGQVDSISRENTPGPGHAHRATNFVSTTVARISFPTPPLTSGRPGQQSTPTPMQMSGRNTVPVTSARLTPGMGRLSLLSTTPGSRPASAHDNPNLQNYMLHSNMVSQSARN